VQRTTATGELGVFSQPFYYLRHGETEANARRLICGALDVELTPLGRAQAHAAARALANEPITAIYSSPLSRARETAEAVASALGLSVTIVPEIAERGRGELEGQALDAMRTGEPLDAGESFDDFAVRVLRGLASIDARCPLLVSHLGVLRVLCRRLAIAHAEEPAANALPLRFVPHAHGWTLERVVTPDRGL
jgi:probable phosphoglycerate mutase